MANSLEINPETYKRVLSHLFKSDIEQVAFLFADVQTTDNGVKFLAVEDYLVPTDDVQFQSGYHISLTDDCLARVIKMAWDKHAALIDLHSHPSDLYPAQFSHSDLFGFREFVPHIWWRLKHKPVMAMVMSPSSFDALVWRTSPIDPEELVSLDIGTDIRTPTNLTIANSKQGSGYE